MSEASQSVLHQVEAKETFDSERYTYVRVAEGDEEYWVAISKQPVEVGKKYVFQKGLMKKNFFSPEFNRVFETLYLVSDFRPMGGTNQAEDVLSALQSGDVLKVDPNQITRPEGSVPLSELFENMSKYNGKQIVVTGKVVKVNPMIMGRNWIHIQDGTVEGKDLTVTTMENIPLGHVVSFEGTIALNKDFGAGYRYDIILEGAVVKK
ncbi:MAG: hypothetical protein CMN32_03260 [Saprospirales bacterium]|nr:hypothetical protein [Saprospirales bacterium]